MIFLPGNVPSLKNSKVATKHGVFHSKTVRKYLQALGVKSFSARSGVENYKTRPNMFEMHFRGQFDDISYPLPIGFHFVRSTKRQFDFHNAVQIIADLLVAHRFIEDDNMDCMIPIPMVINGKWYSVDKRQPGVIVKVWHDLGLNQFCGV